jgi:diguanylate cyclase (GGDEF)-like protein
MEELEKRSVTDPLTRLSNRRAFETDLQQELDRTSRYRKPFCVLMVDVDHFKRVNDTFGHLNGDRILVRLADVLRRSVRRTDRICRFGGEEFAVLLIETASSEARIVAERIRTSVAQTSVEMMAWESGDVPDGETTSFTVSIGVGEVHPDDAAQDVIGRADQALYAAKTGGRNRTALGPAPPAPSDASPPPS